MLTIFKNNIKKINIIRTIYVNSYYNFSLNNTEQIINTQKEKKDSLLDKFDNENKYIIARLNSKSLRTFKTMKYVLPLNLTFFTYKFVSSVYLFTFIPSLLWGVSTILLYNITKNYFNNITNLVEELYFLKDSYITNKEEYTLVIKMLNSNKKIYLTSNSIIINPNENTKLQNPFNSKSNLNQILIDDKLYSVPKINFTVYDEKLFKQLSNGQIKNYLKDKLTI